VVYGVVWLLLATASLVAPWFVVFAVMLWVALPLLVLAVVGLVSLVPASRGRSAAVARGVAVAFVLTAIPSVLVVWGAVAQMGDDYF